MKSTCLALAIAAASLTLAGSISAAEPSNAVTLGDPSLTAGIPGEGPLTLEQINKWLANPANHEELKVSLPFGLDAAAGQITGLDENPMTRAKIELGRQLYFDTRLSSDSTVSCASCHHPEKGWAFDTQFGVGVDGQEGNRNSPVSYNRILSGKQFWDGRAATLEEQAVGPIANPIEMANTHEVAVDTLKKIPGYKVQFDKIFGDGVNIDNVGKALATFERAIVTGPAPYDHYEVVRSFQQQFPEEELKYLEEDDPELYKKYAAALKGSAGMSASARRGREIFFSEKGKCTACHAGANFTDELYHNLGVGMDAKEPDLGRYEVTKDEKDKGAFKTPTIRNIVQSPPYMHDGSQKTLEEVVAWYVKGGHPNAYLSDKVQKLNLTQQDQTDLVNFMKACTGDFPVIETGRLPK
ncbi:cytochrome-c peroxidase [Blastopirellula marina]|uniref:Methylamine utilization protein MauG n=1 Tax=Blastopirellula marina TaxID=124 RepID=A0A2S8GFA9_9BACT|nr:cytochrome c peroxidase [Blastopirellula marina]PQO42764.1 cytochrome-c peroxidase [Blastopirellula marina]PTL46530.1 cytochrome-c peroxidase [Blastopirellula marina]